MAALRSRCAQTNSLVYPLKILGKTLISPELGLWGREFQGPGIPIMVYSRWAECGRVPLVLKRGLAV